jgi:hypothetical protein
MSWDVFLLEEVDRWYQTLKELRPAATSIRILFVFDHQRQAILAEWIEMT